VVVVASGLVSWLLRPTATAPVDGQEHEPAAAEASLALEGA
jgi:hypothetical protein